MSMDKWYRKSVLIGSFKRQYVKMKTLPSEITSDLIKRSPNSIAVNSERIDFCLVTMETMQQTYYSVST